MLEYLVKRNIEHFIIKYYEFMKAMPDLHSKKFQLFVNLDAEISLDKTWYVDNFFPSVKYRNLSRADFSFFKENEHLYSIELNTKNGKVFKIKNSLADKSNDISS